jgi:hypothetical protein
MVSTTTSSVVTSAPKNRVPILTPSWARIDGAWCAHDSIFGWMLKLVLQAREARRTLAQMFQVTREVLTELIPLVDE